MSRTGEKPSWTEMRSKDKRKKKMRTQTAVILGEEQRIKMF